MQQGVLSLGEALIDFIPTDETNDVYIKSPGGAPANVAVGVARLGLPSTFLGKVGEDVLGRFLRDTLKEYGVNTAAMLFSKDVRTGVVFVSLDETGDRSFDFYIDPSADQFLTEQELDEALFRSHKILHFGSISMINEPVRSATNKAVELAKQNGMLVSYDPNLRLGLWRNENQAKEMIVSMIAEVDVLKISEEELAFITGNDSVDHGIELLKQFDVPLILVTLGADGSIVVTKDGKKRVPAMIVNAVDTTGAGDAFMSSMLYQLNNYKGDIRELTVDHLAQMAAFSSVSGGLAASVKGAMSALPNLQTIQKYL
ncbi:aminoimidazole riboside kinase [Aquibacillus sp. 3ASR75-11]|uniref:Aminoimidazole riboside kinase n=1 Tax=Terrihalobacillus insolitus TaxID=2950438 RepID=A0A9X3WPN4_9BACI|nr:aminoimidazole riboside kinase [Terrihalobacillus insolitus]MDC3412701.1 aminoimidazole riboside kinase [Terrihalobacillus insolitus]MDC3423822.1 aminoimidazole riboside kinase [Terrihalobacillus insolitus]